MKVQVGKWGNSWALRIPQGIATLLAVTGGSVFELRAKGDKLVATRVPKSRPTLAEMLDSLQEGEAVVPEDFGPDIGKEKIE